MGMISFRTNPETEDALSYLEERGLSRSEAIRRALVELAERERDAVLEAEVARIAADPDDRAEMARILEEMEDLAPPDDDL